MAALRHTTPALLVTTSADGGVVYELPQAAEELSDEAKARLAEVGNAVRAFDKSLQDFRSVKPIGQLRKRLERSIEQVIALLDLIDGDPDDEDLNEDGGDVSDEPHDEPSQDLEDDEPTVYHPAGAYLPGGGSGI